MSLPPNFGQAFDLSSLTKPKVDPSIPMPGIEVSVENLSSDILPLSLVRPVIVLMWSPRSAESVEMVKILGKLETDYKNEFPTLLRLLPNKWFHCSSSHILKHRFVW
jgi:putative thioredoxin